MSRTKNWHPKALRDAKTPEKAASNANARWLKHSMRGTATSQEPAEIADRKPAMWRDKLVFANSMHKQIDKAKARKASTLREKSAAVLRKNRPHSIGSRKTGYRK